MKPLSDQFKLVVVFAATFCVLTAVALTETVVADEAGTTAYTISHTPTDEEISNELNISSVQENSTEDYEYTSPVFEAQLTFNGLGLVWSSYEPLTTKQAEEVFFTIKIDDQEWTELPLMLDEAKDTSEIYVSHPLFIEGSSIQYRISGRYAKLVSNVRITYFDSTIPPNESMLDSLRGTLATETATESSSGLNIVSREDWGANESYRTWQPSYTTPEMFIIHHTAGGIGTSDSASVVRGIYYWHAVVLGWGDIGYNYIIDNEGTIYEGRYGGDGVVGAHSYNSINEVNYNEYSVGIALLGCFEKDAGACGTVNKYTDEVHTALTNLIARKSKTFDIKPGGTNTAHNEKLKNVVGHRDVDYTYCPGSVVQDQIKTVRTTAAKKYKKISKKRTVYEGEAKAHTFADAYEAGEHPLVTVTYENTGFKNWKTDDVVMQVRVEHTNKRQRIELEDIIAKQTEGTITIDWEQLPFNPGEYTVSTRLYRKGKPIKHTKLNHTFTVSNPYQAKIIDHTLPLAIHKNWSPLTTITLRNTGKIDWDAGTRIMVDGHQLGQIKKPLRVGQKRTVQFQLNRKQRWEIGTKHLNVYLMAEDVRIPGSRISHSIRIDS